MMFPRHLHPAILTLVTAWDLVSVGVHDFAVYQPGIVVHDVVRIDDHKDIPGGVSRLRCLPEGVFAGCIHFMDIVALLIQHIAAGQEFFLGADEKQQIVIS